MGPLNEYHWARSRRRSLLGFGLAAALLTALATVIVPSKVVAEEGHRPFACTANAPCVIGDTYNADGSRKGGQVYVLSHGATDTVQNIFFSGLTSILAKPYGGEHDGVGTYEIQPTSLPDLPTSELCETDFDLEAALGGRDIQDEDVGFDIMNGNIPGLTPERMRQNLSGKMCPVEQWEACAPDSLGYCNPIMSPQHFRIARYGDGQKWVYQQVSDRFACPTPGSPATTFAGMLLNPETGDWGFDPNRVVKVNTNIPMVGEVAVGVANDRAGTRCEISVKHFPAIEGAFWTTCAASKEADCKFPTPGTYLVRLRAGANSDTSQTFAYRSVTGSKIKCGAGINNASGATGSTLSCEYLAIPTFLSVRGEWSLVGLCANCGDVNFQVASGMEQGSAKETESGFAWQLGATLSVRGGDDTNNVEGSRSVKYSQDNKDIVNNSFTQKANTEFQVACGSGALYQWVTGVVERCMPRNPTSCVSVARSNIFRCLPTDMPAGAGPITDLSTAPSGFAAFVSASLEPEAPPSTTPDSGVASNAPTVSEPTASGQDTSGQTASGPTSSGPTSSGPTPPQAPRRKTFNELLAERKAECTAIWKTKMSKTTTLSKGDLGKKMGLPLAKKILATVPNNAMVVSAPLFVAYCEKLENHGEVKLKADALPALPTTP